jgi:hypothetical protein
MRGGKQTVLQTTQLNKRIFRLQLIERMFANPVPWLRENAMRHY